MKPQTPAEERAYLAELSQKTVCERIRGYTSLCGPGWLQSAITLGGGSLASALFLGVLGGYNFMWLQPLAMLMGIVMLGAIAYVTLSTGASPFLAIRDHISPVLAWGWLVAVLLANIVWCLPQYALGTAAVQQNLIPSLSGTGGTFFICLALLATASVVNWCYGRGSRGIAVFEMVLKIMVGIVIVSFVGVVITLAVRGDGLPLGKILRGLIPNPALFTRPSPDLAAVVAETGAFADFWSAKIVSAQRDVMIAAFATAVGINMTFLLPYSMLKKQWGKEHRGLAIFDLSTGLFVPFVVATGCIVVASASQFHARYDLEFTGEAGGPPPGNLARDYQGNLDARVKADMSDEAYAALTPEQLAAKKDALPLPDKRIAAMLVTRDAFNLANALRPLTGEAVAQYIFGIGVLGMALSTIIILMLISGFTFTVMLGDRAGSKTFFAGALVSGIAGATGPFLWSTGAKAWLAIPTSVFGMILLPIAYFTFYFMMNSRSLLGDDLPSGARKMRWNALMLLAAGLATFGAATSIWNNRFPVMGIEMRWIAIAVVVVFVLAAIVVKPKGRRAVAAAGTRPAEESG